MSTFFKRLTEVIEFTGFKTLNDFALNGLKYDSSSKLNRLKDDNKKPSVEILEDIANKFQEINLHYLITGRGNLALDQQQRLLTVNETSTYYSQPVNDLVEIQKEMIAVQRELISELQSKVGNAKRGSGATGATG